MHGYVVNSCLVPQSSDSFSTKQKCCHESILLLARIKMGALISDACRERKNNIVGDLTHEFQFEGRVSYLLGHGVLVVASIFIALNFTKHLLDNIILP